MDPRFFRRLRPIAIIVLFFFTFFSIDPWNYAVWAQTRSKSSKSQEKQPKSSAGKFEKTILDVQKTIEKLDGDLQGNKDITQSLEALRGHQGALKEADSEIMAEFNATEAKLKAANLPAKILARHRKAVSDYQNNFKKVQDNIQALEQLEQARKKAKGRKDHAQVKAKAEQLNQRVKDAEAHLKDKVKKRPYTPLDPNKLPHRTPKAKKRNPRLKKEEFTELQKPIQLAFNGDLSTLMVAQSTEDLPTPEDLEETVEVQFTQEIQDLAAQLENSPVKIYNHVRNNIDFVPTNGSIQGSQMCLLTKQCNDIDTASLLIALLRTSGIPARYVLGTIEVPIDQVMNWVGGFTDEDSALGFIASGGTPVTGLISGGQIVAARLEHVWVEAHLDYIPSRGAVHKEGDTWIPMDASFKQFSFTEGVDLKTAVPFDAQAFLDNIKSTATFDEQESFLTNIDTAFIESTQEDIQTQLFDNIQQTVPNPTGAFRVHRCAC